MSNFLNAVMLKLESVPTTVDGGLHFDNIDIGVMTTILGVAIVFLILIVICLLLAIFAVLVKDKKQTEGKRTAPSVKPQPIVPIKSIPAVQPQSCMDDKQLVAVITAAIAASMGTDVSTDGFVVRRIRRVGNWNQDAIEQQQGGLY